MQAFERQEGIAFLLIYYSARHILYYMRCEELLTYVKEQKTAEEKVSDLMNWTLVFSEFKNGYLVPYLDGINLDLTVRERT